MRIREISVARYRSLKDVKMTGLGDLVVLIGKNGSGKSNILEALELFFSDLNFQSEVGKSLPNTTWFDKLQSGPIEFVVSIELDYQDMESIFGKGTKVRFGPDLPPQERILEIHRQLDVNSWKNVKTKLGEIMLIEGGKVMVSTSDKELDPPLIPETANMILTNLNNLLKNAFKLTRSPRESAERPPPMIRPSIVDPESKTILTQLALSKERKKELEWDTFEKTYEEMTGKRLLARSNDLEFRVGNLTLPAEFSGSGDQALMIIMRQFIDPKQFHGIEEPETRLHSGYVRRLHSYLRQASRNTQIFIATHSAVFVDKAFLSDTWYVSLDRNGTKVKRIGDEDLKEILLSLEIKPSDVFLANSILFVEGPTEEHVLPIVAEKVGIDLGHVSIIPTYGKSKGKYNLRVWSGAIRDTELPMYMLLDKNAESEILPLVKEKLINRDNYYILRKKALSECPECDFEDYYDKQILKKAVKEYKGGEAENAKRKELDLKPDEPVVKKIDDYLGRNGWKVSVGVRVVESMTPDQIREEMDDIVRFLRKVAASADA